MNFDVILIKKNKLIDDTLFIKTFWGTPVLRVLMFFLENNLFDYPKTEFVKHNGGGDSEKKTGTPWKATFYRINMDNTVVKKTSALNNALCKAYSETELPEPAVLPA